MFIASKPFSSGSVRKRGMAIPFSFRTNADLPNRVELLSCFEL